MEKEKRRNVEAGERKREREKKRKEKRKKKGEKIKEKCKERKTIENKAEGAIRGRRGSLPCFSV